MNWSKSSRAQKVDAPIFLPMARRRWMTFFWTTQLLVMGAQVLPRLDSRDPAWLFYSASVFLCVAIGGLITTWFQRIPYDAAGVTYRDDWWRSRHLSWSEVTRIVPAHLSANGLELRTTSGDRMLSARPTAEQLEQLHRWHAAVQSNEANR